MANSVDPDQTAPIGAVCSGSTLFASIRNSSLMQGNYLPQTTSADDIFRCIFFLGALRVKSDVQTGLGLYWSSATLPNFLTLRSTLHVNMCYWMLHMKYQALFSKRINQIKKCLCKFNFLRVTVNFKLLLCSNLFYLFF